MSERVRATEGPGGRLVARKTALGPDEHARLHHEATILRAAGHPGLVTLLAAEEGSIDLAWTGSRTLATHPPATPGGVAVTLAGLATTVADLHQMGISHGAIHPEHVLLDAAGRPVLCSLGRAERVESLVDPGHVSRSVDDVASLGRLLGQLLSGLPARRSLSWSARTQRRRLLEQADHTASPHPPSARALAASLADVAASSGHPGPTRPGPERFTASHHHLLAADDPDDVAAVDLSSFDRLRPPDPTPEPGRHRDIRAAVASATVLAVVGGLAILLRPDGSSPPPVAAEPASPIPAIAPSITRAPTIPDPETGCDRPGRQLDAATLRADLDGDGCADTVTVDGNVVTAGAHRWEVGEPGDVIAIADWDCDGEATAAVLRPGDGHVFVFESWAPPRGDLGAIRLTTVPDAAAIDPENRPCPDLVVTRTDGTTVRVPTTEESSP